ncbi:hypothetical protein ARALYDRAFT_918560 [Arabidopsis lyrata subsp. lyrata]|uniref:C2H2-type domain-containing protein n=1 Tax=Arabidopsis lyrata subsp. lyrata TaxID=81972 RepID=D7MU81_ARALL|nr:uncharacterized protein LOC9302113 [Arabidopsis lyrata subsp. lyrata]EFH40584.1 hypothetical protein ARALYDRAFT_918560 [Arabidopsis lyrata subsp. lyrata]|eukprot:XP_002864325.1 uncharacterized protein LOC9302113 [Arabidopsis lyrata subsp. lyrata]
MENQSMSSSSSCPHKHDQKLKSSVVAVEVLEEETVNNPDMYYNKIYICYLCKGVFQTPHALGGHGTTEKDQELERQQKIQIESRLSNKDKSNLIFGGSSQDVLSNDNHLGLSLGQSIGGSSSSSNVYPLVNVGVTDMNMNNYSSHDLPNDINLDLTLGPSNSIGGSNDNNITNSYVNEEVTRKTTNMIIPVRPRVSRYHFVAGNPLDSITRNIPDPSIAPPHRNTYLFHDSFSLQENGSGSSHS